jgi:hypothetical protein
MEYQRFAVGDFGFFGVGEPEQGNGTHGGVGVVLGGVDFFVCEGRTETL